MFDDARLDEEAIARLGEGDALVLDGLLGEGPALACAAAAQALDAAGHLTAAGVGKARHHRPDVRGDRTAWFSERELPPALTALWRLFDTLREALNHRAWAGLRGFELQLACYPGNGARYAVHRDALRGDPARRVTAIYYLNPTWRPSDGGELVVVVGDDRRRIAPQLDRLVLFRSDALLHEVLPTFAPRFAATAFYRGATALPESEEPVRLP